MVGVAVVLRGVLVARVVAAADVAAGQAQAQVHPVIAQDDAGLALQRVVRARDLHLVPVRAGRRHRLATHVLPVGHEQPVGQDLRQQLRP